MKRQLPITTIGLGLGVLVVAISGSEGAMLYRVAVETGLRAGERSGGWIT